MPDLGEPLTGSYPVPGGHARLFERGVVISGPPGEVVVSIALPMIGRPHVATGTLPILPADRVTFELGSWDQNALGGAVRAALSDRVGVSATGSGSPPTPLQVGGLQVVRPEDHDLPGNVVRPAVFGVALSGQLTDRTLYDVALRGDGGQWHLLAPHAVYHKQSWTDFGLVHVTDIHVARRIDRFRPTLKQIGRPEAAARMHNWNDRLRGFIRYANFLHSIGELDLVVATGDLYDFMFEFDDNQAGQGNAAFFRDLLLGRAPGPDFPDVEELRVPIFTVPGNHDYRKHPYALVFDLHDDILGIGHDFKRINNYSTYNLVQDDAVALWNALFGGDGVPNVDGEHAAQMVEVDASARIYRETLADRGSYVVELGDHRIAMIDSAHDVGMLTSTLDAIRAWLGILGDDERSFVGGSPNCVGVTDNDLAIVRQALLDAPPNGLFLLGLHAPPFNLWAESAPYYLRESQRPALQEQAYGFLLAYSPIDLRVQNPADVRSSFASWFSDPHDHRPGPPYIKRGGTDAVMRFGVSRGRADDLMALLVGVGMPRRADLVLAGHTHRLREFIVAPLQTTGEIAYYLDFYTHNPAYTYPTVYTTGYHQLQDGPQVGVHTHGLLYARDLVPDLEMTYVDIDADAMPNATPWPMPWAATYGKQVQVPPYRFPLSEAPDPKAWWDGHRPVVLQTAALGPQEDSQVTFSGFRLLRVRGNVISKVFQVPVQRLEEHGWALPLDQAVAPDPPRRWRHIERSRRVGAPGVQGQPTSLVLPSIAVDNVIYRGPAGSLHELWRTPTDAGTSNLTELAGAPAAAGRPFAYADTASPLTIVLYRAADGHLHSVYWWLEAARHDNLTGSIGAPQAGADPSGFFDAAAARNYVFYRDTHGHLNSLYWVGPEAAHREDWSQLRPEAPLVTGRPSAYRDTVEQISIAVYRGTDGEIHSLYAGLGPVGHDGLSAFVGLPPSAGEPFAYFMPSVNVHQIVYRGVDGAIYEIYSVGTAPAAGWSPSASAPDAPPAVGDPVAYYSAGTNTKHVIYRSADGHLNELWWVPGAPPAWVDLTIFAAAPTAVEDPTAYTIDGPNSQHVAYRSHDGNVHEIRW
jgi:predicted MPP superfamily phosphohydrolase